jgi:hypothetical protein
MSLMHSNWSRYDKHLKWPWLGTPAWHVESRWQEARAISTTSSYTNTRNSIFWWQQCVCNVFQCVEMCRNNLWVYKAWVQELLLGCTWNGVVDNTGTLTFLSLWIQQAIWCEMDGWWRQSGDAIGVLELETNIWKIGVHRLLTWTYPPTKTGWQEG